MHIFIESERSKWGNVLHENEMKILGCREEIFWGLNYETTAFFGTCILVKDMPGQSIGFNSWVTRVQ